MEAAEAAAAAAAAGMGARSWVNGVPNGRGTRTQEATGEWGGGREQAGRIGMFFSSLVG